MLYEVITEATQRHHTITTRPGGNPIPDRFFRGGALSKARGNVPRARIWSLAVTYFRMGKPHTIIGAEQFHFRVRNGIGWFPLAIAARQTGAFPR